ncbi:hypothetical protein AALP_AA3G262500 [Arabis alpina]|uniref:Histone deacetylase interacting domain-containing protein n=1 Tax=Arabis alpina TaxID=50452 RepID=A0A087HBS6_ARAAL|nr:hypothetical protein AALP_AA3G262500 [Arabis alpina]
MRTRRRPLMNQGRDFYQTPKDTSEEEIQRGCDFVKRLKTMDDKRIFDQYVDAMKSYQSGSLSSTDLKNRIVSILGNHEGLVEEFHQLLSDLASRGGRNSNKAKTQSAESDRARTVKFLNKVKALDKSLYEEFLNAFRSPGGLGVLVKNCDVVLRDHPLLKEEFITYLIDSRLLKLKHDVKATYIPIPEDKQKIIAEWEQVTPSYYVRPEAEEESSSDGVLSDIFMTMGNFDPGRVVQREELPSHYARMNNLEDDLYKEDMFLETLTSVIEYGKDALREKPPVGFDKVIKRYYGAKEMPEMFKTDPKLAVRGILHRLESMEREMRETKESKKKRRSSRVARRKL